MRKHQRETENVNEGEHLKEQVRDKRKKLEVSASDKALDDDDTRSINSFEDEGERVRCLEFNEKTGMSNPQLCKCMKFPNGNIFRTTLRKYAVKKLVDIIKFKLNEKTKILIHCKYECGWKVYASQILWELTFQIKTMVPNCTCGRKFKHSQVTSTYVAKKYLDDFNKNHDWAIFGVKHQVMQDIFVDLSINRV